MAGKEWCGPSIMVKVMGDGDMIGVSVWLSALARCVLLPELPAKILFPANSCDNPTLRNSINFHIRMPT